MPARSSLLTLGWASLVAGIAVLMFVTGSSTGVYLAPVRLLSVLVGAGYLVAWLGGALFRASWRPRSALTGSLAIALTALGIASLTAAIPRLALDYLAYAVLLTALYLMLVKLWTDPDVAARLGVLAVVLSSGIGIGFLIAVGRRWIEWWSELGHFAVPPLRPGYEGLWFGNPNALAAIEVLLFLVAVGQLGTGSNRRRAGLAAVGLLVAVVVLLTGSRGAWLGCAVTAVALAVTVLLRPEGRRALRTVPAQIMGSRVLRAAALMVAAGVVVGAVVMGPAIAGRLGQQAAETRTVFWNASIRMFVDAPLTGVGPGAWEPLRIAYTVAPEIDYYIPHAHNLPLHVMAELGIVGTLAGVVICISVLRLIWAALGSGVVGTQLAGWTTLAAVCFVLGQHMVDEYVHQPAVLLAIALPIAQVDGLTVRARAPVQALSSRFLTAVLLVATVSLTVMLVRVESVALTSERAVAAANVGRWDEAAGLARDAAASDPDLAPYRLTLGIALLNAGDLEGARRELASVVLQDDYPEAWLALGAIEQRLGNRQAAVDALERAMRLGAQHPAVAVDAAVLYRDLGMNARATAALADAFIAAPTLASDPYWMAADWAPLRAVAIKQALEGAQEASVAAQIALEAGLPGAAAELAASVPGRLGTGLVLAARAVGGDAGAFEELHAMAVAQLLDAGVVGLCVRVAEQLREAAEGSDEPVCDGAGSPGGSVVVRVGTPDRQQAIPGPDAAIHAVYAYRRSQPWNLVPPWLPSLTARLPGD